MDLEVGLALIIWHQLFTLPMSKRLFSSTYRKDPSRLSCVWDYSLSYPIAELNNLIQHMLVADGKENVTQHSNMWIRTYGIHAGPSKDFVH